MFRSIGTALCRTATSTLKNVNIVSKVLPPLMQCSPFGTLTKLQTITFPKLFTPVQNVPTVQNQIQTLLPLVVPSRSVTKFSLGKGKRKSVAAVTGRFFRLHWGGWIRTHAGMKKRMWKKSPPCRKRMKQHVFCNSTQSWMLDKMVTKYWRKPKFYIDDPYAPYHTREEFIITRRKPL